LAAFAGACAVTAACGARNLDQPSRRALAQSGADWPAL